MRLLLVLSDRNELFCRVKFSFRYPSLVSGSNTCVYAARADLAVLHLFEDIRCYCCSLYTRAGNEGAFLSA